MDEENQVEIVVSIKPTETFEIKITLAEELGAVFTRDGAESTVTFDNLVQIEAAANALFKAVKMYKDLS